MTTVLRRTRGSVPPPMVGSSVTLSGATVFVFGGRLAGSRTITSTLYALSLNTLTWELVVPPSPSNYISASSHPDLQEPTPRYFHSAAAWGDKIVFFGGEAFSSPSPRSLDREDASTPSSTSLQALSDVFLFDVHSRTWIFPSTTSLPGVSPPTPRFGSLAVIRPDPLGDSLYVIGGQEVQNSSLPAGLRFPSGTIIDYRKRQLSFTDIACVDLEAFGVYQPPFQQLTEDEQELGLQLLSIDNECDFEVVSADRKRYRCPRRLLEPRWPSFREAMDELVTVSSALGLAESDVMLFRDHPRETSTSRSRGLRASPNRLDVPLSATATHALLIYFAAMDLVEPEQLEIETLASLLLFTNTRPDLSHLRTLVVHALHYALDSGERGATRIYEAALKGSCKALQIRAVRFILEVLITV
ncbi:hypothetical protein RQP46_001476 [Phenoliferia psychrophenolica]